MSEPHPRAHSLQPVLMLLLATAGWGLSFPLMKALLLVQHQLAPTASEWWLTAQSLAARFGLAALVAAIPYGRRVQKIRWPEWKLGLGLGLLNGGGMLFQMTGLGHTHASTSAFLTSAFVVIIPVTVALRRRKWPSGMLTLCCALVVVGLSILSRMDWRQFHLGPGEQLTLLSAVIFSGAILWLARPEFFTTDKCTATVIMFATTAAIFGPALVWPGSNRGVIYQSSAVWILLAGLVIFCTVVAFTLMNVWQPHLPPTHAGLIYCAEPVVASMCALLIPAGLARLGQVDYANETITINLLIGGSLITLANGLAQFDH